MIEPIFEADLSDGSYGYRPERGAPDAVKSIEELLKQGHTHVYDADIQGYFDHIPHDRLLEKIGRRISDKNMMALLRRFLRAPVIEIDAQGRTTVARPAMGTPQGGVISPLFANIYLNDFSELINTRTPCTLISYADDFVIMHKDPYTPRQIQWFEEKLAAEGLTISESKTRIVDMGKQRSEFDFLGFTFKRVPNYWGKGHGYVKIQSSKKSQIRIKTAIRDIVKHRTPLTLDQLISRVNPIIRGWRQYFRQCGYPKKIFFKLDWSSSLQSRSAL